MIGTIDNYCVRVGIHPKVDEEQFHAFDTEAVRESIERETAPSNFLNLNRASARYDAMGVRLEMAVDYIKRLIEYGRRKLNGDSKVKIENMASLRQNLMQQRKNLKKEEKKYVRSGNVYLNYVS
jgi:hypothetical protein